MDNMKPPKRSLNRYFRKSLSFLVHNKRMTILWFVFSLTMFPGSLVVSQESGKLTLDEALMCEDIKDSAPVNKTVVFSIALRKAICFTSFSAVPDNVVIYHNWYNRDKMVARVRLRLKPPRWSTFSSVPLKATDKGPWRVEILDQDQKLLRILRFSVTD